MRNPDQIFCFTSIDWNSAYPHEKYIYVCLMDWLGRDNAPYDIIDIDSTKICHEGLDFVRDNRITIKEFADNVVKIPRAHVSLYFHNPKSWTKAKDSLRVRKMPLKNHISSL